MSLQGYKALTLVNVLDQVRKLRLIRASLFDRSAQAFEAPNVSLDLRRRCVRILRRVCASQYILPSSCTLLYNISKEGDAPFHPSRGFANVWKGRHNGNFVRIKAFRMYAAEDLSRVKKVCSR